LIAGKAKGMINMDSTDKQAILLGELNEPTEDLIKYCVGHEAYNLMQLLDQWLHDRYDIKSELRFWDSWQRGYWHKKVWLFDIIFQENGLLITLTITDKKVDQMQAIQPELQPRLQTIWQNRQKFGPSSWPMEFALTAQQDINDLLKILAVKQVPKPFG
jgi:hypothetical protein